MQLFLSGLSNGLQEVASPTSRRVFKVWSCFWGAIRGLGIGNSQLSHFSFFTPGVGRC